MKKVYNKYGFSIMCGLSLILTGCSSDSKTVGSTNYVIQEIIPSVTPDASRLQESMDASMITITPVPEKTYNDHNYLMGVEQINPQEALENLGSVYRPSSNETIDLETIDLIGQMPAKSIIKVYTANAATLAQCFTVQEISPEVYNRMENKSYSEGCTTDLTSLRYVRVLHYGFDEEIHIGELVVNQLIADDIVDIFKELFDEKYPIEQMVLIDEYYADDNKSMEANNTSSFNFRLVDGTTKLSKHAYGLAVDINPLYNPYVRTVDGNEVIVPENGIDYADRTLGCDYYIQRDDVIYKAFIERGFTWGGDWINSKDYQHFQKVFQ